MTQIISTFQRDIERDIDPVISVVSIDKLALEVDEYVATDSIRRELSEFLGHYESRLGKPGQNYGVWISGFFGSGKSLFAKLAGYLLENPKLPDGDTVIGRFLKHVNDPALASQLLRVQAAQPAKAVIFDLSRVAAQGEGMAGIVYRELLRALGYAPDFRLAALEQALEEEGGLQGFRALYATMFGNNDPDAWEKDRNSQFAVNRASSVMSAANANLFPEADSWARTFQAPPITPEFLAKTAERLRARRLGSKALVFVIDELGQFIARDPKRILDTQGIIQSLSEEGAGRIWVLATSQERLDDLVGVQSPERTELARLRDRFIDGVDLLPSDIAEVTSQRLLLKTAAAETDYGRQFAQYEASLKANASVLIAGANTPSEALTARNFINLYPLLPYQVTVILRAVNQIRRGDSSNQVFGAANRPMLKIAQDLLRKADGGLGLAYQEVGALARLDQICDLLMEKMPADRRDDLIDTESRFSGQPIVVQVAKALAVLQLVPAIKRTPDTIAATLYPKLGATPIKADVQQALELLVQAGKARSLDGQFELLDESDRTWMQERAAVDATGRGQQKLRDLSAGVFSAVRYNHKGLRTFSPTLYLNDTQLGSSGDLPFRLTLLDGGRPAQETERVNDEARTHSRANSDSAFGVLAFPEELLREADDEYRSSFMLSRYANQPDRESNLKAERERRAATETRLGKLVGEAIARARYYYAGAELTRANAKAEDAINSVLANAIPVLYRAFDQAAARATDADIASILKQQLGSLSAIFGAPPSGLDLVNTVNGHNQPNPNAAPLVTLRDLLQAREHANAPTTGQALESALNDPPYGWDASVVRLLAATAFRAGLLEVQAQGARFTDVLTPGAAEVFTRMTSYRTAVFKLRTKVVTPPELMKAITSLNELGLKNRPDVIEAEVAAAIRQTLDDASSALSEGRDRFNRVTVPGADELSAFIKQLEALRRTPATDDLIRAFNDHGALHADLKQWQARAARLTPAAMADIKAARQALNTAWPAIKPERPELAASAERLQATLNAPSLLERLPELRADTQAIREAAGEAYQEAYAARYNEYKRMLAAAMAYPGFEKVKPEDQNKVIGELVDRRGETESAPSDAVQAMTPSLNELRQDTKLAGSVRRQAEAKIDELVSIVPVKRLRSANALGSTLDPGDAQAALQGLDAGYQKLRQDVQTLLEAHNRVVIE